MIKKSPIAPVPRPEVDEKYEDPQGRVWKVTVVVGNQIILDAAGGGATGGLRLARKSMRGWKKHE